MNAPPPVWETIDFSRDALVEASAGTGKTYTLEHIFLRLVEEIGVPVDKILVVTFTEKAAGELADRLRSALSARFDALPPDSPSRPRLLSALRAFDDATISTIHSFCQRVLREYAFENGLPMASEVVPDTRPAARRAVLSVLRSPAFRDKWAEGFPSLMGGADVDSFVDDVAKAVEKYRSDAWDVPVESLDGGARSKFLLDLFESAVAAHRRLVAEASLLSYDDMIRKTAEVVALPESAPLRAKLREAFRVALVDEFQDTDALQWSIFRTLFSRAAPDAPVPAPGETRCLVAVGDPKQSIYSFRGADIGTYLAARSVLAAPPSGQSATLSESHRSPAPLLEAFNTLFSTPGWFDAAPGPDAIAYSPVTAPPPSPRSRYLPGDPDATGRASVTLLESLPSPPPPVGKMKGFGNRTLCLPVFARNAAAEIKRLLALPEAVPFRAKDGTVERLRFRPGDFCFLVRTNEEALPIQRALDAVGIRHSFYKEKGLSRSPEAESVLALLDFVAHPDRRGSRAAAFLTPFFGIPPSRLDDALASPPPEIPSLVQKWTALADARQWSRLFDSFVFDTSFWRPAGPGDTAFDRRFAGVRQILDDLLATRAAAALSVDDFADVLRDSRAAADLDDLRERETEEDRVVIMTMHIAKGLEFPVVFVPYGFSVMTPWKPASAVLPLPGGARRRVFRIDAQPLPAPFDAPAKEADRRELRRLLYVALTRARLKLYLPWSAHADASGIGSNNSALRAGFLGQAILNLFGSPEAAAAAVVAPADAPPPPVPPAQTFPEVAAPPPGAASPLPDPTPLPDFPPDLASRRLRWDSFSSLHAAAADPASPDPAPLRPVRPETDVRAPDDDPDPAPDSVPSLSLPAPDALVPRGTLSGTVFHDIMEALCNGDDTPGSPGFQSIGNAPDFDALWADPASGLSDLVFNAMRAKGLPNRILSPYRSTARALARMAWTALRAPLPFPDGPHRLADVARADRRAEVSFVVSETLAAGPAAAPRPGAFNGFVDLLFRAAPGRPFFILDWKTNALPDYTPAAAAAAMDACGYRLQYRLYALAVADWLGPANLAGAAYLFVRGGETGPGPAVFAEPFPADWRADFRAYLPPLA